MTVSNQIRRNPLIEALRQLCADIREIADGDCQGAAADLDYRFEDQRLRIQYTVKPLIPRGDNRGGPVGGGMKR